VAADERFHENTLMNARSPDGTTLYVSFWLRDPGQAANFRKFCFIAGPKLAGLGVDPLRVLVDECTMKWLEGRAVRYKGRMEPHGDGEQPVIAGLCVGGQGRVDLPFPDFLPKFMADRKKEQRLVEVLSFTKPKYPVDE